MLKLILLIIVYLTIAIASFAAPVQHNMHKSSLQLLHYK